MAKKKVPSVAASKPTKKKVAAPVAQERPKAARKSPAKSVSSSAAETFAAAHAFDAESIGAAAGVIWWALNEQGPQELAKLKQSVEMPTDAILTAVGWLAREGKLAFETNGKALTIGLA